VVLLYWYGSFYPFELDWQQLQRRFSGPVSSWLMMSTPTTRADILFNVLAYIPVGALLVLVWPRDRSRLLLAALAGSLISLTAELGQNAFVSRFPSYLDLATNTGGSLIGAALAVWTHRGLSVARMPFVPLVLLLLWVALHAAPFLPASVAQIEGSWNEVLAWRLTTGGTAWWMASWVVLFRILDATRLVYWIAPVSLAFKLLVDGQRLSSDEILGFFLALPCLRFPRLSTAFLIAGIAVHGLAPFHLRPEPAAFAWRPFAGFLESKPDQVFLTVIQKAFLYLGGVWMISKGGAVRAGLAMAVLLGSIEFLQIYVAGHTPESADPLMALLAILLVRGEVISFPAQPAARDPKKPARPDESVSSFGG
jgi:VanZ family protein